MYTCIFFRGNYQAVKFVYRKCPIFLRYFLILLSKALQKRARLEISFRGKYKFHTFFDKNSSKENKSAFVQCVILKRNPMGNFLILERLDRLERLLIANKELHDFLLIFGALSVTKYG